jgi:hypothetical protein
LFILHGSDSLDIPYINSYFTNFGCQNDFPKFLYKCFDTRFVCEYNKYKCGFADNKCSLYFALLYANAISQKEYYKLLEIEKKLHPIYKTNWLDVLRSVRSVQSDNNNKNNNKNNNNKNNNNNNNAIINYAIHDVLHLNKLLNNLINAELRDVRLVTDIYRLTMLIKLGFIQKNINYDDILKNNDAVFKHAYIEKISTFRSAFKLINSFKNDIAKLFKILKTYKLTNLHNYLNDNL